MRHVLTARLPLDAVVPADLDEHYALMSDPDVLVWRGPDAGNPDPDAVRPVYADRPLDDDVLARVVSLH